MSKRPKRIFGELVGTQVWVDGSDQPAVIVGPSMQPAWQLLLADGTLYNADVNDVHFDPCETTLVPVDPKEIRAKNKAIERAAREERERYERLYAAMMRAEGRA